MALAAGLMSDGLVLVGEDDPSAAALSYYTTAGLSASEPRRSGSLSLVAELIPDRLVLSRRG